MLTQGRVRREHFRLVSGEHLLSIWRPDGGAVKAFCSACGSSLFGGTWPEGEEVSVRLGTVDDDPGIRPQYHTFVASKAPWEEILDDLPQYPEGLAGTPHWNEFGWLEHAGWERVAERYEEFWEALTASFVGPLLDLLGAGRGSRLLDLACGPGAVSEAASSRGARTLGVDFSSRMIRVARRRNPFLAYVEGDAHALPFDPGTFDAVAINFGVLHFSDPDRVLAEVLRVLEPGGKLGFTVWSGPEENPWARILGDAIEAHADPDSRVEQGPPRYRLADPLECRRILGEMGFVPGSVTVCTEQAYWRVPTHSFAFAAERDGGVRTAAVLAAQAPERLERIRRAVEAAMQPFAAAEGYAIPMTARVISAASPGGSGD